MLVSVLLASAGLWPQLPKVEHYINVCEAAYIKHSEQPALDKFKYVSTWVYDDYTHVSFGGGNLGLITEQPQSGGVILNCLVNNKTTDIERLNYNWKAGKNTVFISNSAAKDVMPAYETEFYVADFKRDNNGQHFLGAKLYSQRGIGVSLDRINPSDAILHGFHSLPGLDELPPAHAGIELPAVEASRYQDNDDGTVTDIATGLMWQRCASGREWREGECQGEALVVPYSDAEVQVKWANHNSVAGYNDWRLPKIEELAGLVYCSSGQRNRIYPSGYGGECQGDYQVPTLMLEAFDKEVAWGGTQLMPFWSSSLWRNSEGMYWSVFFDTGFIGDSSAKLDTGAIRLVREVKK